jgi:hypothetical protein
LAIDSMLIATPPPSPVPIKDNRRAAGAGRRRCDCLQLIDRRMFVPLLTLPLADKFATDNAQDRP